MSLNGTLKLEELINFMLGIFYCDEKLKKLFKLFLQSFKFSFYKCRSI